MSVATESTSLTGVMETELVTFRVADTLMGVDILQVEEINRHVHMTDVPHAPECVRGVINLRGDVVTVIDLRAILGLPPTDVAKRTRTVVVHSKGELIGLMVDQIADVVTARNDDIDSPPANVSGMEGRFFKGVYKLDTELLIILNIDAAMAGDANAR